MADESWSSTIDRALEQRKRAQTFRERRAFTITDSTHVALDGRTFVNFASNNYLGLSHHPRVIEAFTKASNNEGVGSGAAALVSGYTSAHKSAERALAKWKGTESSVMLSSGYAANLAAVQTIVAIAGKRGVRFLLDKLCHASLIDAVKGSESEYRVFPHNNLGKLRRLLSEPANTQQFQVVVTESIFSMDGDAADLAGLDELKKDRPFLLLLDEAHGSGVYGEGGAGFASEVGRPKLADFTIVTLSKAIGVSGGAICASQGFCDSVVNFGRSYIYSTNTPPALAEAVEASLAVMADEPHRQKRLRDLCRIVRRRLVEMGFELPAGDSPIIPIILGDEGKAMDASAMLASRGLIAVAIRPPTVARGSSRLRITLSCDHSDEEIDQLLKAVKEIL